ncbi:lipoamide acyltransferase component of branched-chain alpha-keto acid dehydrogenase complex, mitochondrial isoform X2 [Thrips palmi]|uniref:Dihydrolipoamide acetyltransferase component of pyruvate dehydrogenase complex n=1 Tax=Thrips palmi TaxID=161013 RepID=A0A6P8YJ64_THRPL|nr:lipoamide acyltransferase component of branched-chain alpha-keto acid dehydrogenase complex, mitochondrial isoform X2 [Thrips palmi]
MAAMWNVVRANTQRIANFACHGTRHCRARSTSAISQWNGLLPKLSSPKSVSSSFIARSVSVPSSRQFHCTSASLNVVPFNLSDIGEGITEVVVKEWFVNVGDKVVQFDNICEVQSDKASVTITSRYDGVIAKLHYKVDETAKVGLPLVDIAVEGEGSESDSQQTESASSSDSDEEVKKVDVFSSHGKALATPAVRRIAGEHKIDISLVKGSGKSGRVMKEDILAYISGSQASAAPSTAAQTNKVAPSVVFTGTDRTVPIQGFTKAMVKTMTAANAVPHFVYSDEVDVGALIELRLKLKEAAEKRSIKLTYMPFFLKAASLALNHFPILNASVNADCTELTYKARHNIGMAFDTANGLIVPNIKDVQSLQLFDIAREMERIIAAGRNGTLAPKDITGGTFSLSNIGSIGGTYTKPVLLVPEVAIGALGRFQKLPRFGKTGAVEEAHIMCVSWAADHRVIDGATVARFSNMFKELIENPVELLVQ